MERVKCESKATGFNETMTVYVLWKCYTNANVRVRFPCIFLGHAMNGVCYLTGYRFEIKIEILDAGLQNTCFLRGLQLRGVKLAMHKAA